jgi:hypothetical protein
MKENDKQKLKDSYDKEILSDRLAEVFFNFWQKKLATKKEILNSPHKRAGSGSVPSKLCELS